MTPPVPQPAPQHAHHHADHHHVETHFAHAQWLRDVVLGVSDGLTVPFALAAGLTGAVLQSHIIVVAGLAEIAAGSVAMGLGGYLATSGEAEHYRSELARERREIIEKPEMEKDELREIFAQYRLPREQVEILIESLSRDPEAWVKFMMRFELNLDEPHPGRAWRSGLTIALAYAAGGLIPLSPYFSTDDPGLALKYSAVLTGVALAVFGYFKAGISGSSRLRGTLQTLVIGAAAGLVAFFLAQAVTH